MPLTMPSRTPLAIDRTSTLDINGSLQSIRLCAARAGLPPLLIVQGGPGLPVLHEIPKFQRLLNLENAFLVCYWDQRGCGNASANDAHSASMAQQVDDLRAVLRWLHGQTGQRVLILGISLGATMALQAVEREFARLRAVVAISPDSHTDRSDAAAHAFLQGAMRRADGRRLRRRVMKLGPPPCVDAAAFRRRASLLADLGTIERGRTFSGLLLETLAGMITAYGAAGAVRALRNMNILQRRLLADIVALDLLAHPPRVMIPVHYVFGEHDALTTASMATELPAAISAPAGTAVRVSNAGHMVHFDQPDIVRSIVDHA
jgi:pimeloyl-ACP methyl ester carboxylesterase